MEGKGALICAPESIGKNLAGKMHAVPQPDLSANYFANRGSASRRTPERRRANRIAHPIIPAA